MIQQINKEQLAQFGNLEFLAKQVVEGFITGMHKSPFHGFSVEFAEHRLYNPGESTRHIDWKLFGRSDKLFTKKYEEETNLRCQLVIDTSSSMLFEAKNGWNKLEFSVLAAASMIELMKKQRDAVGLSLFDEKLRLNSPAKSSMAHHRFLISELEKQLHSYQEASKKSTNAVTALHDIAEICHKRSLVIIFTDMLDDPSKMEAFFEAIQHLKHNKHEVVIFHVVDKKLEMEFGFENRPMNVVDMETGEKMKLQPVEIKEKYKKAIKEYFDKIALKCTQYHVDFMPCDVNEDLQQCLSTYLLKRGKLY